MKVKNVKSSALFAASSIFPSRDSYFQPEGDTDDARKANEEALCKKMAELPSGDEKNKAIDALRAKLLPDVVKELDALKVKLPSDLVPVSMSLGHLFFDLYSSCAPEPAAAPLAVAIFKRNMEKRLTRLMEEEVELTSDEISVVKRALEDPNIWENVKLTAFIELGEEKRYLEVKSAITQYFLSVLDAAISYVLDYEATKA